MVGVEQRGCRRKTFWKKEYKHFWSVSRKCTGSEETEKKMKGTTRVFLEMGVKPMSMSASSFY